MSTKSHTNYNRNNSSNNNHHRNNNRNNHHNNNHHNNNSNSNSNSQTSSSTTTTTTTTTSSVPSTTTGFSWSNIAAKANNKDVNTNTSSNPVVNTAFSSLNTEEQDFNRAAYRSLMLSLANKEVQLELIDGSTVTGILVNGLSFTHVKDFVYNNTVILKNPTVVKNGKSINLPNNNPRKYDFKNIITIQSIQPINLSDFKKYSLTSSDFRTDSNTSRNYGGNDDRKFESVNNSWLDPTTETSLNYQHDTKFDQFETNDRLFNVKSSFDESKYTKILDHSSISADKIRQAEKVALEIEKSQTSNIHLKEERGQLEQEEIDEEALYSGVISEKYQSSTMNLTTTTTTTSTSPTPKAPTTSSWSKPLQTKNITPAPVPAPVPAPATTTSTKTKSTGKREKPIKDETEKSEKTEKVEKIEKVEKVEKTEKAEKSVTIKEVSARAQQLETEKASKTEVKETKEVKVEPAPAPVPVPAPVPAPVSAKSTLSSNAAPYTVETPAAVPLPPVPPAPIATVTASSTSASTSASTTASTTTSTTTTETEKPKSGLNPNAAEFVFTPSTPVPTPTFTPLAPAYDPNDYYYQNHYVMPMNSYMSTMSVYPNMHYPTNTYQQRPNYKNKMNYNNNNNQNYYNNHKNYYNNMNYNNYPPHYAYQTPPQYHMTMPEDIPSPHPIESIRKEDQ